MMFSLQDEQEDVKVINMVTNPSKLQIYFICALIGAISGGLVTLFLVSLEAVTSMRQSNPLWIWGLPIAGLLIPWIYKTLGYGSERGIRFLLEEIHKPEQLAPWSMAPLIYITTLITHLVGGSAGREGTALQISASAADRLADAFKISLKQRRWVLMAGLSGGFSAALGAPFAGFIFGLEVISVGKIDKQNLIECFIASFVSWTISVGLQAPHFQPLVITPPDFSFTLFFHLLLLALFLGLISRLHVEAILRLERLSHKVKPAFRTALGGAALLVLYLIFPLHEFQGLGLESIRKAFEAAPSYTVPLIKFALTVFTLSVGFKGGEFVPLVFIGTTVASVLAHHWFEPISFFAALGYVSLFGAAAKTPWTCAILAVEFFGWEIAPYALLVCLSSYATAGPYGIYPGQQKKL